MKSRPTSKSVAVEVADSRTYTASWSPEPVPPNLRSSPLGNTSPQVAPAEKLTDCSHRMFPMDGAGDQLVYHKLFAAISRLLAGRGVTLLLPVPPEAFARVNLTLEFAGNVGLEPDGQEIRIEMMSALTVEPAVAKRIGVWDVDVTPTRDDVTLYPRPCAMIYSLKTGMEKPRADYAGLR